LTNERRVNAPPDALTASRRTPRVGEAQQPTKEARRRFAVIITLRKCNLNSIDRRSDAYRSSRKTKAPYIAQLKNPSIGAPILSQFTSRFLYKADKVQGKEKRFRAQDAHYLRAEF